MWSKSFEWATVHGALIPKPRFWSFKFLAACLNLSQDYGLKFVSRIVKNPTGAVLDKDVLTELDDRGGQKVGGMD